MKIIETIVGKAVERMISEIEKISEELDTEEGGSIIKNANRDLKNKQLAAKAMRIQYVLGILYKIGK